MLQLLSISLFSYLLITSSITVAEDLQQLTGPLQDLNLEDPTISEQEILTQGAKMISAYETLRKNVTTYFFTCLLIFFTIPGFIWALSLQLVNNSAQKSTSKKTFIKKNLNDFLKNYLHYLKTTLVIIFPLIIAIILIGIFMLESDITAFTNAMQVLTAFAVIVTILTLAALSVQYNVQKISLANLKSQFNQVGILCSKRLFLFLFSLIIAAIPIALGVYFLYYATLLMENFPLMVLAAIFTLTSIIIARFYIVLVSRNLVKN